VREPRSKIRELGDVPGSLALRYFALRSLIRQAGHLKETLVSVSESTTMSVPQQGQVGPGFLCSSDSADTITAS
jgi:hypothetical protein